MSNNPTKSYEYKGMEYIYPTAHLLADNGIGQSEYAARQCYNSFSKSENSEILDLSHFVKENDTNSIHAMIPFLQNVEKSELLKSLSFVHFHESTLEHSVLSFLLTDFSRGVLQELARHRIASYSVQSTRYTMASLINAFTATLLMTELSVQEAQNLFIDEVMKYDMLCTANDQYNRIELEGIFFKLRFHYYKLCPVSATQSSDNTTWLTMTVAKETRERIAAGELAGMSYLDIITELNKLDRRNVGDAFKHIITDNIKVSAVMTINLRSFKNFLQLRDSGAAWFQIEKLAQEMKAKTPQKYLDLIIKPKKVPVPEKPLDEQIKEITAKLEALKAKALAEAK